MLHGSLKRVMCNTGGIHQQAGVYATTCSDDYLWLPFVTLKYVLHTGDKTILYESVYFLEGRVLNAGEHSYYDLPVISHESANLYDHCIKSIEHRTEFRGAWITFYRLR